MKVYIAGPMTGIPEYNYPEFHVASIALARAGHEPVNPAQDHGHPLGTKPWHWYMRRAITLMMTADAVALLDGWEGSSGAVLESELAIQLDMPVRHLDEWLREAT